METKEYSIFAKGKKDEMEEFNKSILMLSRDLNKIFRKYPNFNFSIVNKETVCKCGHDKGEHICGRGGCMHQKNDNFKTRKNVIVNMNEVVCDCNKFEANNQENKISGRIIN